MIKGLNLRFVYTGELVSIEEENSLEYVVPGYAGYSSLMLSCRCLARLLGRDPGVEHREWEVRAVCTETAL